MGSKGKRLLVVVMAMAMVVALPAVALAHHPEIEAEPDCMLADGSWYLDYKTWAWEKSGYYPNPTDDQRTNNKVVIYLNGVAVDSGAFNVANGFMFGGTILVPAGVEVATLRANPEVRWGVNEDIWNGDPGDYRETTVDKPTELCFDPPGTGTPGYWHKIERWEYWKIPEIIIGGMTYTAQEAVDIINKPVKGDKTLTMFPALAAAMNNVKIGNPSWCIADYIAKADAWMADNPAGSGVKAKSDEWKDGEPLYKMLDKYNNGYLCAPHRD